MLSKKPLNPNAEPYFFQQQNLPLPTTAAIGYSQYGRHFHPCYAPCDPCGFLFYPPNHFVMNQQEALREKEKEGGVLRVQGKGPAKRNKQCNQKKRLQAEWQVKKAKETKKLPENGGVSRRAVIPFPTTAEEAEVSRTTTVMIRNVPNQFKLGDLLRVLDNHCFQLNSDADPADFSKFDFVYLPMDYRYELYLNGFTFHPMVDEIKHAFEGKKSNLGYAFVNFTSATAAFTFYKRFHGCMWDVNENRKICEGKETLLKIFSSKIFVCNSPGFLPVVFLAARDGHNRLSKATPVGKHVWGLPKKSIGS